MYHVENSMIDHVTKRAIGMKVSDGVSRIRLMLMLVVVIWMIGGVDTAVSLSLFSRDISGIRLMMNVVIRLFFMLFRFGLGWMNSLMMVNVSRRNTVRVAVGVMVFMFYYLELRQVFWCLRPMECCYPLVERRLVC